MVRERSTPLPAGLARFPLRTFRPQDIVGIYAHPRPELARLSERGVVHRLASGYYVVVPQEYVGRPWIPSLEASAAGIASAIHGADHAVLMGMSAARLLGAMPRALATAVVTVPSQHRPIALEDRPATVWFVKRNTGSLDVERIQTPLGSALATTTEQTVLDLARRPTLGGFQVDVPSVISTLYRSSSRKKLAELAAQQRLTAVLHRVEIMTGQNI